MCELWATAPAAQINDEFIRVFGVLDVKLNCDT